uniref:Uncharacterized protein n=1 Tax=Myotis myotis TaxID=51298 RepID=A0A7J7TTQ3_MYOMY|nr:hypothetical protein mMyoMyo1_008952 [Myotis myotis]
MLWHTSVLHFHECTRGPVHEFVHRWGPSGWPSGIGLKPAVQHYRQLLPAAHAQPGPAVLASGSHPVGPDQERLTLPQQWSPAMSPVSGTLPRGVACGIRLKLALRYPPRGPGLRDGSGQAEGPHQCTIRLGRDRRRAPGCVWPISLSPDQPTLAAS